MFESRWSYASPLSSSRPISLGRAGGLRCVRSGHHQADAARLDRQVLSDADGQPVCCQGLSASRPNRRRLQPEPKAVSGGPAWIDSDRYDVVAKTPGEVRPTLEQQMAMLRKLLTDRFNLGFHREKKEMSVYALTIAKNGPKLKESEKSGREPRRSAAACLCACARCRASAGPRRHHYRVHLYLAARSFRPPRLRSNRTNGPV